jgi:hypothetical protein
LINLNHALIEKQPEWPKRHGKVILLQDNDPSHTSKLAKDTLKDTFHPRCNPLTWRHLAITSSHQWDRDLQSSTSAISKKFKNGSTNGLPQFLRQGIHNLPERWSKCVEADGQSFE